MTAHTSIESIFRPAFVLMSGRALGFVAAFAIPVVLARVFDQSEFGTYKQLFLIYATLYSIAQLGMAESLFYFLPAAPRLGGRYALNAVLVLGVAGAACLALLAGAQAAIADWLNNARLIGNVPLIGVFLLLMLASAVLEIVLTARKRHFHASCTYAVSDLVRAGLFIVPVLWFGRLEWLLYGAIAFALLRLAATLVYLWREFDGDVALDAGVARAQLAYAAPFSIYVLIEVVQQNLHLYAVSFHFDAATFAIYAIGCLSIPLVDFLTSSAGNVMMVRMREHLLDGGFAAVLAIWGDTTRKLVLVFAPLVGGLLVVSRELIVGLFTVTYEQSVPVFMVWSLTLLFAALLTDSVLRVYAQMRFLMLLSLFKLVLVAAMINWFLATFDLLGAVLVVLVTIMISKAVALGRIKAVMRCTIAQFLPWRSLGAILVIAATAALPALAVKSSLPMPELARLLLTGLVYVAAYLGLLFRFGPLSLDEKRFLTEWALRPVVGVWRSRRV